MPLHECQCAAVSGVKKDMVHLASLFYQHTLVYQHFEAQLLFIETTRCRHIPGAETQMIN
jgi:hypothetical protein